jgi:hypothetical protein
MKTSRGPAMEGKKLFLITQENKWAKKEVAGEKTNICKNARKLIMFPTIS